MSLPVFETPIYSIVLPGSGETVKFRPFLVKEQKQLLMAASAESEQQTTAVEEIVRSCTFGKVETSKIASFDVEYLFMNIRARSVGENIDLVLTCECGAKTDHVVDITTVQVDKSDEHQTNIELDNDFIVKMRHPRMREVDDLVNNGGVDGIIKIIARSIDTIWQGETMYSAADYTVAEMIEFVENLSPASLDKIERFFATMPVLRHRINWQCAECGNNNQVTLEGIQSFFV
jgi:hypothetical protein